MPTNKEVSIRGGYQPFQFKRDYHLDIFGNAVDKITQQHEKALEEENNILAAINKIPLNEADAPYKQQLLDYVKARVSKASISGNLSSAVTDVKQLAGEIASNPELFARAQRNEQYQVWRGSIEDKARKGEIDARTAKRLIQQNPYNFDAITDDKGRVIGGTDWRDTGGIGGTRAPEPVNKVSLEAILKATDSIVATHKGGGAGYTARDASGKIVDTYSSKASTYTKSSGGWEEKRLADLQNVFNELAIQHPEIGAYIEQMRDDDIWELQQLEQENLDNPNSKKYYANQNRINELKSNLRSANGTGYKSNAEYLDMMTNKSISAMSYRNSTSDVSISGGSNNNGDYDDGNPYTLKHTQFIGSGDEYSKNKRSSTDVNSTAKDIHEDLLRQSQSNKQIKLQ